MDCPDLAELLELERHGWDSLCESRGGAFYGELMTPDALMVLVNGMVLDRDAIAASLDDAPAWSSYEITDPQLVALGGGSAGLVYRASAHREGEAEPFVALMTSVYRMLDGQPRLALYQQTTITH
jgi:hypothetical protein